MEISLILSCPVQYHWLNPLLMMSLNLQNVDQHHFSAAPGPCDVTTIMHGYTMCTIISMAASARESLQSIFNGYYQWFLMLNCIPQSGKSEGGSVDCTIAQNPQCIYKLVSKCSRAVYPALDLVTTRMLCMHMQHDHDCAYVHDQVLCTCNMPRRPNKEG